MIKDGYYERAKRDELFLFCEHKNLAFLDEAWLSFRKLRLENLIQLYLLDISWPHFTQWGYLS